MTGRLALRGDMLTIGLRRVVDATLGVGIGAAGADAGDGRGDDAAVLRHVARSLLRFFAPRLSPYTTAVADGTIRVVGELADVDHLLVEASVEQLQLKLFDYPLRTTGRSSWRSTGIVLEVKRFRLTGEGTRSR